jgi:glucose dehydrogenase
MRAAFSGALFAALALGGPAIANDDVLKNQADPNNWASQSGDYSLTRFSKLDQINTDNVKNLKVAWTFSTGVLRGHEGSPLVIGDTIFVHTPFPNIVYALDLNDENKIIWKYEPKQDPAVIPIMCCDTVNRGPAYADGKIFLYQADTTLVALDAKTGKEVWKTAAPEPVTHANGYAMTGAPLVVNGVVITGVAGAGCCGCSAGTTRTCRL